MHVLSIKVRNKWPPNLYPTSLTFDLSRKNDRSREKHGFYFHTHVQVRELRKESGKGKIIFREKTDQSRSALHVDQNRSPLLLIHS
jgi:hypothetical protein